MRAMFPQRDKIGKSKKKVSLVSKRSAGKLSAEKQPDALYAYRA